MKMRKLTSSTAFFRDCTGALASASCNRASGQSVGMYLNILAIDRYDRENCNFSIPLWCQQEYKDSGS